MGSRSACTVTVSQSQKCDGEMVNLKFGEYLRKIICQSLTLRVWQKQSEYQQQESGQPIRQFLLHISRNAPYLPHKFCITFVFHFSWVLQPSQEKLKTMIMQNLRGQIRCIMGDVQVAYNLLVTISDALQTSFPRLSPTRPYRARETSGRDPWERG